MRNRRGQTILEYTVILIIIIGAFIAMKDYIKRGIQGRWKAATDDLSDPYDPTVVNSNMTYSTQGNSQSVVTVQNGELPDGTQGQWTARSDYSNMVETKSGYTQVGN